MTDILGPNAISNRRGSAFAVFIFTYALMILQFHLTQTPELPVADALGYARLADNLLQRNTLAIGPESDEPTRFFPPLYPLLLATVAKVDGTFSNTLACVGSSVFLENTSRCSPELGSVVYLHLGLSAVSLTMIWYAGIAIFHNSLLAALAVLFAWASGRFSEYAALLLTENLFIPCFTAASLFLMLGIKQKRFVHFLFCGVAIGLAALTRPSAQYAAYAIIGTLVITGSFNFWRHRTNNHLTGSLLVVVAYLIVITPWLVRNNTLFNRAFLTDGYASFILVERVAYNDMTWREFGISFLYWLPWPGEQIAARLFAPEDYRRLKFDTPDSYYVRGVSRDKQALRAAYPTEAERLSHLIDAHVLGAPWKHMLITLALTYRGIWIVKYWTLFAVPAALFLLGRGLWRRRDGPFAVFILPALFMLGFHAFVSVNVHRYNLILIPGLALASGWLVLVVAQRVTRATRLSPIIDRFKLDRD